MDTDIKIMEVIVPLLIERDVGSKLRINSLMQFPREKYNNYLANQGNPAEKMKTTLDDNWYSILDDLANSRPGLLDSDSILTSNINMDPQNIACEDDTCPYYANCISSVDGRSPVCRCKTGFQDLDLNFPGRACGTQCTDSYCSNRGNCSHNIETLMRTCSCNPTVIGENCETPLGLIFGLVAGVLVVTISTFSVTYFVHRFIARRKERYMIEDTDPESQDDFVLESVPNENSSWELQYQWARCTTQGPLLQESPLDPREKQEFSGSTCSEIRTQKLMKMILSSNAFPNKNCSWELDNQWARATTQESLLQEPLLDPKKKVETSSEKLSPE
ncbi:unnamed protein product [Darwinula stevensoni]|uniref:EGF-like domain-containing protein n=1 Tax=Darwinula stevensoni TaxID=69355 RepID=A0A7R8XEU2_9CRUS|nr:unnamed protein product [Darwinula stevensoni]CAG0894579.1 unnamed protein product [Darwinula stevensoni]